MLHPQRLAESLDWVGPVRPDPRRTPTRPARNTELVEETELWHRICPDCGDRSPGLVCDAYRGHDTHGLVIG